MVLQTHFSSIKLALEYYRNQKKLPVPVAASALVRNAQGQFELDWKKVTNLLSMPDFAQSNSSAWMEENY